MGHHIDAAGRFQSDKYPELAPDKIVLSFKDPAAKMALWDFARWTSDKELGDDIRRRLRSLEAEGKPDWHKTIQPVVDAARAMQLPEEKP